jgi:polyphosphate glucokinase
VAAAAKNLKIVEEDPKSGLPAAPPRPEKILVVDIGGSKVKILVAGETEPRKAESGKNFTPAKLVEAVKDLAKDWQFDAVSIGYPGTVGAHGPRSEPGNLGSGWVGFDFAAAFGIPVRIINDAAMQALGSYEGGRMLFLGLGTGLGSAMIAENAIIPLELGRLHHKNDKSLGELLGKKGMEKLGKEAWAEVVKDVVATFSVAFLTDYVVIGGGNAKKLDGALPGVRMGHNLTAFRGGVRLWNIEQVPTLSAEVEGTPAPVIPADWRVI